MQSIKSMTGGKAVVEALRAEDTKCVFGLIGSATMEVFDALYDANDIRFVGVRDERTGTHMADAYARVSGKAGIVMAGQNGPGVTNLVTGLSQAYAAYSPVVAIAGMLSTEHQYRDAFQEVDQQALANPITKKTWTVQRASRIPEMFREGFRTALSPRRGPVQINLPRDILAQEAQFEELANPESYRVHVTPAGDPDVVAAAAGLLANAARPLIVAGGGIKANRSYEAVLRLAELISAPIVTAAGHGDAIPNDHSLFAGQMGPRGNAVASALANEADVILALGTRLGFNTTFYSYENLNRNAKIIQVEIEPTAIGRFFAVTLGIWADAEKVARQLARELESAKLNPKAVSWAKEFGSKRRKFLEDRDEKGSAMTMPIQPQTLFKALREVLPRDGIVTIDAGTMSLQATDSLNHYEPPCLITPLDFGLVGFSFAAGLGAKAACPERPVISLMGDGGFGMTISELSTAVSANLPTTTIVMNNGCWGAEKSYQRDFYDERYIGADVFSPPYDKVAELYGAKGYRVERPEDIGPTVEKALNCGRTSVVDILVDPNALYSFRRDAFTHRKMKSSA